MTNDIRTSGRNALTGGDPDLMPGPEGFVLRGNSKDEIGINRRQVNAHRDGLPQVVSQQLPDPDMLCQALPGRDPRFEGRVCICVSQAAVSGNQRHTGQLFGRIVDCDRG